MEIYEVLKPVIHYKCLRCGREWPAGKTKPAHCPECNSPYWDRPRRVDVAKSTEPVKVELL